MHIPLFFFAQVDYSMVINYNTLGFVFKTDELKKS